MKKFLAAMIFTLIFSSGIYAAVYINQEAFNSKFEALSGKLDSLGNKIESELKILNSRMDGLEKRMDGLENRMDRLEGRVEKIEERSESRLNLILTAFAAGVAWLTLVATILTFFKKPEKETANSSITLADVLKLIEENNKKLKLNQEV